MTAACALEPLLVKPANPSALDRCVREARREGRLHAPGDADAEPGTEREVVLVHPRTGRRLQLTGRVLGRAHRDGRSGVDVLLTGSEAALGERLEAFAKNGIDGPTSADNVHQRVRSLTLAEQLRLARSGDVQERKTLERIHGKLVWEALLQNPRLTIPEVTRIARNGMLPSPLLELIVGNDGWLASAQVRRALLCHPRLKGRLLTRVLRALPRAELKVVPQQTAYPPAVREAAKRMGA